MKILLLVLFVCANAFSNLELRIGKNSNLYDSLIANGFARQDVFAIVAAAKPYKNLNRLRSNTKLLVSYDNSPAVFPTGLEIRMDEFSKLVLKKNWGQLDWVAEVEKHYIEKRLLHYKGFVESSLWESAIAAKMPANFIVELAEVFAWEVDFSREVRKGDSWRICIEQVFVDGRPTSDYRIIAAQYVNQGQVFEAFRFTKDKDFVGYFDSEGNNLRKMFLKSPLRYGRISSRFQRRRFHPVLKKYRPHYGVDYAAPIGTPIRSVGDGVVQRIGRRGGAGKMLKIRHTQIYATAYKHLSRFKKGLRRGSKVKQGEVIGYVGNTGLSTGPHLHFEFYKHGRYVDPLRLKFPSANPVHPDDMQEFLAMVPKWKSYLPSWLLAGSSKRPQTFGAVKVLLPIEFTTTVN